MISMLSFNSTQEKLDTRADVCKKPSVDDDAVSIGLTSRKTSQKQMSRELLRLMFANQRG